jgi:hypothetical protein
LGTPTVLVDDLWNPDAVMTHVRINHVRINCILWPLESICSMLDWQEWYGTGAIVTQPPVLQFDAAQLVVLMRRAQSYL